MKKWFMITLIASIGTSTGIGITLVQASSKKAERGCELKAQEVLGDAAAVIGSQRRKISLELLDDTQKALNLARECMQPGQKKLDQNLTKVLGRIRAEVLYDIPICEGMDDPVKGCTAEGWPLNLPPPQQRHICNAGLWGVPKNL